MLLTVVHDLSSIPTDGVSTVLILALRLCFILSSPAKQYEGY